MKSQLKVHIGDIIVSIEGCGAVYSEIAKEMSFFPEAERNLEPDIIYQFSDKKVLSENKACVYNRFQTKFYNIYISDKVPIRVIMLENLPLKDRLIRCLPENIQRALYGVAIRRLLSVNELLSAAFIYEVFFWTSLNILLRYNATYLHASSFADINGAYIFAGPQQSGKTVIVNSFILDNNQFCLLSNDKVIINNKGKVYAGEGYINLGPRVFLLSEETMYKVFNSLSALERFVWKLFKAIKSSKGIAKRVCLSKIYNNKAIIGADIKYCFYLQRAENSKLELNRIKIGDFAFRASKDMISEMKYTRVSDTDADGLQKKIVDVCTQALVNVKCFELLIPYGTPPRELRDFINDIINKESKS